MCFSQKHFRSGGYEDERQMTNYVNCKDMRFVIGYLIDVDDVSPATVPGIPFTWLESALVFPQRGRDYETISLSYETKVINPVGEPRNTT